MMTAESNTPQNEIKEADSNAIKYPTQLESQPRGHLEGVLPLVQTQSAHPTGGLITLSWPGNSVPTALEIDEDEVFRRQFSKSWGYLDAQKKITAKQPRTGEPIEISPWSQPRIRLFSVSCKRLPSSFSRSTKLGKTLHGLPVQSENQDTIHAKIQWLEPRFYPPYDKTTEGFV